MTAHPSARTASLHRHRMLLHSDALGDIPKGVTVNTTIERAGGINLYVVCTDRPNDGFEKRCFRKKRVRSL